MNLVPVLRKINKVVKRKSIVKMKKKNKKSNRKKNYRSDKNNDPKFKSKLQINRQIRLVKLW